MGSKAEIIKAIQELEELGGCEDVLTYIQILSEIKADIEKRIINATINAAVEHAEERTKELLSGIRITIK